MPPEKHTRTLRRNNNNQFNDNNDYYLNIHCRARTACVFLRIGRRVAVWLAGWLARLVCLSSVDLHFGSQHAPRTDGIVVLIENKHPKVVSLIQCAPYLTNRSLRIELPHMICGHTRPASVSAGVWRCGLADRWSERLHPALTGTFSVVQPRYRSLRVQ